MLESPPPYVIGALFTETQEWSGERKKKGEKKRREREKGVKEVVIEKKRFSFMFCQATSEMQMRWYFKN